MTIESLNSKALFIYMEKIWPEMSCFDSTKCFRPNFAFDCRSIYEGEFGKTPFRVLFSLECLSSPLSQTLCKYGGC